MVQARIVRSLLLGSESLQSYNHVIAANRNTCQRPFQVNRMELLFLATSVNTLFLSLKKAVLWKYTSHLAMSLGDLRRGHTTGIDDVNGKYELVR